MTEWMAAFLLGLLGSTHCIGMCGGFAAAIGVVRQPLVPSIARQLIYSLGRVFTYAFLGAVGGFAGLHLSRLNSSLVTAQQAFSILAGVVMLLVGGAGLGLIRFHWLSGSALGELVAPMFKHFLSARRWPGFFLAGLANGFLPCGLVYAALAMAAGTSSVAHGLGRMAVFGAGTVPAMVAIGCGSTLLGHVWRGRIYRVAACFIILAGGVTIWRARTIEHCAHAERASAHGWQSVALILAQRADAGGVREGILAPATFSHRRYARSSDALEPAGFRGRRREPRTFAARAGTRTPRALKPSARYMPTVCRIHSVETDLGRVIAVPSARLSSN